MTEEFKTYPEYEASQQIWKIVSPIFIILGTLGNTLSIVVLSRKEIRKSTTSVYLSALAISDIMILYSGLLRQWILATFEIDIRLKSEFICKTNFFLVYFFADLSAWILIAVTLERVVLVWHPHTGKKVCSRMSAMTVITAIIFALALTNGHILIGNGKITKKINNSTITSPCTRLTPEYKKFFFRIWPWIDLAKFCISPFLLLLIGNSLIIAKIIYNRKKMRSQVVPASTGGASGRTRSSVTVLLFTLNAVYLVTSTPISIYLLRFDGWVEPSNQQGMATSSLVWALVNILMYANNTFNFVLYCLSGKKFRGEVRALFCGKVDEEPPTMFITSQRD